jgi:hypothetical protein
VKRPLLHIIGLLLPAALLAGACGIREAYVSPALPSRTVDPLEIEAIDVSAFFIGDAGEPSRQRPEPTFLALERDASQHGAQAFIVFLGDNIYPRGLPSVEDPSRSTSEWALMEQLRILRKSGTRGVFVSGNHDWDWSGSEGWEAIARQERFVRDSSGGLATLVPPGGCPGPEVIDLDPSCRLVLLNTEWWLQPPPRSGAPTADCLVPATEQGVLGALAEALESSGGRVVMVAGHHPLETYGTHGGYFPWEDHLFPLRHLASWLWIPLPLVGSAYPVARTLGISNQDLSGPRYRHMVHSLDSVLAKTPPTLYIAGHEHTLQVLQGLRLFPVLVSGNGIEAHDDPLTSAPTMLFGDIDPGFMRVDVARDGRVRLAVIQPADESGTPRESFSMWLRGPVPSPGHEDLPAR